MSEVGAEVFGLAEPCTTGSLPALLPIDHKAVGKILCSAVHNHSDAHTIEPTGSKGQSPNGPELACT